MQLSIAVNNWLIYYTLQSQIHYKTEFCLIILTLCYGPLVWNIAPRQNIIKINCTPYQLAKATQGLQDGVERVKAISKQLKQKLLQQQQQYNYKWYKWWIVKGELLIIHNFVLQYLQATTKLLSVNLGCNKHFYWKR